MLQKLAAIKNLAIVKTRWWRAPSSLIGIDIDSNYIALAELQKNAGNYELISSVAQQLTDQINEWSIWLQSEIATLGATKGLGAPVIFGEVNPGPSAMGYLWVEELSDDFVAPVLSFNGDFPTLEGRG